MKIFHNPRCSKSRAALSLLNEKDLNPEIIHYLDTPPTKKELIEILTLLNIDAIDLARKGESAFKENNLSDVSLSNDDVINVMIANPSLIERPIVINNGKAAIGRPIENIIDIL